MNKRLLLSVWIGFVSLLLGAVAAAQPGGGSGGGGADPSIARTPAVTVKATAQRSAVKPGELVVIAVELRHESGYHTWPAAEVKLPDKVDDGSLIRTEIAVTGPEIFLNGPGAGGQRIQWPKPKSDKVASPSGDGTVEVPLYSGQAVSYITLKAPESAGESVVEIETTFQACDENQCLRPETKTVSVKVKVDAAASAVENSPELFKGYTTPPASPSGKADEGNGAQSPVKPAESKPPPQANASSGAGGASSPVSPAPVAVPAAVAAGGSSIFGFDIGSNIFVLAIFAALAGFLLNLTPCVLPVIPLKVFAITKHATTKKQALALGLWMALGVVAFWTAIGAPMAFISRTLDPSQFIFGIWWITLSIGLVITVLSLGIMGLFTLELPQSVHSVEVEADRPFGSFLFGVFTAVLGLPCFGFFAGGLFAAAAALPSASIMAIFIGLGVGMALPYLVLSIYPSLLKFLPSVGPGSQLLKEVMGLCLLAAAAYFITVGVGVLLKERPYLSGVMMWWAVVFFIVLAGLWLVIRIFRVTRKPAARLMMPLVALAACLGSILFAQAETRAERNNYEERREAARLAMVGMSTSSTPVGIWLPYTPELLKAAQASGRPVFMDFTADWCITCKALKAAILNRDPVKSAFKDRGVVLIEVDCSVSGSAGSQKLAELGRTGVPTWAIYGPGNPRPQFVSVDKPTAATVLSALDEAGAVLVPGGGKAASTGK